MSRALAFVPTLRSRYFSPKGFQANGVIKTEEEPTYPFYWSNDHSPTTIFTRVSIDSSYVGLQGLGGQSEGLFTC